MRDVYLYMYDEGGCERQGRRERTRRDDGPTESKSSCRVKAIFEEMVRYPYYAVMIAMPCAYRIPARWPCRMSHSHAYRDEPG